MSAAPFKMTERELVVRFLRRRADFWERYAMHKYTARVLRNEADLIEAGNHNKTGLTAIDQKPAA